MHSEPEAWEVIATAPEGRVVLTCIDAGRDSERNVQRLIRHGRLWFLADESMYVYYNPTHWKEIA